MRRIRNREIAAFVFLSSFAVCPCLGLPAQTPKEFAAVSIKRYAPGSGSRNALAPVRTDPAGAHFTRQDLRTLIAYAYGIAFYQIAPAEDWTATEFFDFDASTSAPATNQEIRGMMRHALADRFGLRLSTAVKMTPVLELVVAPGGLKARPLDLGQQPAPAGTPPAGSIPFSVDSTTQLITRLAIRNIGGQFFGRTFVDETGLTGRYNLSFYLRITPSTRRGRPILEVDWRGIIPALKKLGIDVKPATTPMVVYKIDAAHQPLDN